MTIRILVGQAAARVQEGGEEGRRGQDGGREGSGDVFHFPQGIRQ